MSIGRAQPDSSYGHQLLNSDGHVTGLQQSGTSVLTEDLGLNSLHPHSRSQPLLTPVPGDPMPSLGIFLCVTMQVNKNSYIQNKFLQRACPYQKKLHTHISTVFNHSFKYTYKLNICEPTFLGPEDFGVSDFKKCTYIMRYLRDKTQIKHKIYYVSYFWTKCSAHY